MAKAGKEAQAQVDTDQDRYPNLKQCLQQIGNSTEFADRSVERLEFHFFANGEATYRFWEPRALEPEGGYIPGPDHS